MRFEHPSEQFLANVMGQHYIIVYGDQLPLLQSYCDISGIRVIR